MQLLGTALVFVAATMWRAGGTFFSEERSRSLAEETTDPTNAVPRFGPPGVPREFSNEEVIFGVVVLEGEVPMYSVAEVGYTLRQALAMVTAVEDTYVSTMIHGDVDVLSPEVEGRFPRLRLKFHYQLLPPLGGSVGCVRAIVQANIGQPNPVFLLFLDEKMSNYAPTATLTVQGWRITLDVPVTERTYVSRPVAWTGIPAPETSTTPRGMGITPAPDQDDPVSLCLRADHPCICASLLVCAWVEQTNGLTECRPTTQQHAVGCNFCPSQQRCPGFACAAIPDACACAASVDGRRWDEASGGCVVRNGGATPCSSCAHQDHCEPPQILTFSPPSGAMLGSKSQNPAVKVTFNQPIQFTGLSASAEFRCEGQATSNLVLHDGLEIEGRTLTVDATDLVRAASRDSVRQCELFIGEGVVRDRDGVAFLGMQPGEYVLGLQDAVAPQVYVFDPRNGEQNAGTAIVVTLTFSEEIVLGPSAASLRCSLKQLGEANTRRGDAVTTVAEFSLADPRLRVDAARLLVDLSDVLEPGLHYSLVLPEGAVMDTSNNVYSGLPIRAYAFRTAPTAKTISVPDEGGGLSLGVFIGMIGGGLFGVIICVAAVVRLCRIRRVHQSYLQKSGSRLSTVRPAQDGEALRPKGSLPRSPSSRSHGSLTSATSGLQNPSCQAPLGAFDGDGLRKDEDLSGSLNQQQWASKLRRSQTYSPMDAAAGSPGTTPAVETARKEWARRTQANQRWHEAFATAAAARRISGRGARASTTSEPPRAYSQERSDRERSQRGPAEGGANEGRQPSRDRPAGAPRRQQCHEHPGPTLGAAAARGGAGGAAGAPGSASADDPGSPGPSPGPERGGGGRSPGKDSELEKRIAEVDRKLRGMMEKPIAERKKMLKELMLEFHPDKNSERYAKEVFQFVNSSRDWFLCEA